MRGVIRIALLVTVVLCALGVLAQDIPVKTMPDGAAVQTEPLATTLAPQPQPYHPQGTIIVPESSVARAEDAGLRAHTNTLIFVPSGQPMATAMPSNTFAETVASMSCVYKVGPIYPGCVPANGGVNHPTGGWGAIALVDAYDNPKAATDLAYFSTNYGLPAPQFRKIYANTSYGSIAGLSASCSGTPAPSQDWGLEEDLDIEWAHAMAPNAKILLVEACTNYLSDLQFAVLVAAKEVSARGGGDVSNSWGSNEYSGEVGAVDNTFRYYWNKIVYFASAGDYGWGAQYPSSSPWVVSAGGTTVNRDAGGNFLNESCWAGSGGGVSAYETWQNPPDLDNGMGPWANFQYAMFGQTARQTPDISFNADPNSGVWVYDSYGYNGNAGWFIVGGTSVSSPALAGIVNASKNTLGQGPPNTPFYSNMENDLLYAQLYGHLAYPYNFYDVTTGSNGTGHNAAVGYDQCTGIGSPRGHLGK